MYVCVRDRVVSVLKGKKDGISIDELVEEYKEEFKSDLKCWKAEFVSLESFLRHSCSAEIADGKVTLRVPSKAQTTTVQYLSHPQFSQFFGFTEEEKDKGVAYRVWRFEVSSAIQEGLHSSDVIG